LTTNEITVTDTTLELKNLRALEIYLEKSISQTQDCTSCKSRFTFINSLYL